MKKLKIGIFALPISCLLFLCASFFLPVSLFANGECPEKKVDYPSVDRPGVDRGDIVSDRRGDITEAREGIAESKQESSEMRGSAAAGDVVYSSDFQWSGGAPPDVSSIEPTVQWSSEVPTSSGEAYGPDIYGGQALQSFFNQWDSSAVSETNHGWYDRKVTDTMTGPAGGNRTTVEYTVAAEHNGVNVFYVSVESTADDSLLTFSANSNVEAGLVKLEGDTNVIGNDMAGLNVGGNLTCVGGKMGGGIYNNSVSATAIVSLVRGEGEASVNIFGYRITFNVAGSIGSIGGDAEIGAKGVKVEVAAGAGVGIGLTWDRIVKD